MQYKTLIKYETRVGNPVKLGKNLKIFLFQGDIKERTILSDMFNKSSSEINFFISWKIYSLIQNDIRYYFQAIDRYKILSDNSEPNVSVFKLNILVYHQNHLIFSF